MKLIAPSEAQTRERSEEARDLLRLQALREAERDLRIDLARAEADFNATLAKNREAWEKEESEHRERKAEMKAELEKLEEEKLKSLVPFDILKEGVDNRFKDAETFLKNLREREERAEELTELLEEKLDSAGEREEDAKKLHETLILRQKGIDSQADSVKSQSEALTVQMREFYAKKEALEKELREREEKIGLRESSAKAKEDSFIPRERDLDIREKRLADERGVLKRAWDEFRRLR